MDISQKLAKTKNEQCRGALIKLLERYCNPAFGSLPKREIDILFFEVLEDLNVIKDRPHIYNLLSDLKVTRAKARSLLYDRELRKLEINELDNRVMEALTKPLISKDGDVFKLQIESPLVADHLKARVQELGYLSDGSFSPSIITLSLNAVLALFDYYLSDDQKKQIKNILNAAGVPDTSFKGVMKSVLKKMASKFAADAGEALIDEAESILGPLVKGAMEPVKEKISIWFEDDQK